MNRQTEKTKDPFIDSIDASLPIAVIAEGCLIKDENGKEYIDACSGAITTSLGHQHPEIIKAIQEQLAKSSFVYRTQFTSEPKRKLANMLTALTEEKLSKVYFVGGGSEAVESALKLALQYFWEIDGSSTKRTQFVSLRPSYHGSTLGALGVTAYRPLEEPFTHSKIRAINIESPDYYRNKFSSEATYDEFLLNESYEKIKKAGEENIAAVIVEPIGGASTGARVLSDKYLQGLRNICDQIGALLIFDEVLTGIGRTGKWFGYQHSKVLPDIIALGKGLGAGYYPVGAIMCKESIAQKIQQNRGFMHGHTYAGNPMGCAVGCAVIETIIKENLLGNVNQQGRFLNKKLKELAESTKIVGNLRGKGLLYAFEFVRDQGSKSPFPEELSVFAMVTKNAKDQGLLVYPRRPLDGIEGDHILICPPFIINEEQINVIVDLLAKALAKTEEQLSQKKNIFSLAS